MTNEVAMTRRVRLFWLAGALAIGLASQFCVTFGVCAAPLG